MGAYNDYLSAVVDRFWAYAEREFGDRPELFERSERSPKRSPVFGVGAAEHNLLYPPRAEPKLRHAIVTSLHTSERHRHFASMRSSQALAQSVFGSLAVLGKAGVLAGLSSDDELPTVRSGVTVQMEYRVEHLGGANVNVSRCVARRWGATSCGSSANSRNASSAGAPAPPCGPAGTRTTSATTATAPTPASAADGHTAR